MARILVLNGPNLNLLGTREPEVYGTTTLEDIHQRLVQRASAAGHQLDWLQSNPKEAASLCRQLAAVQRRACADRAYPPCP